MLNNFFLFLRALVSYILFAFLMLFFGIPLLFLLVATPEKYRQKNRLIYFLLAILFRGFIYASLISFKIIMPDGSLPFPAIYVANHQSAGDVAILGYLQRLHPHFWFYWDHFSYVPFLSWYFTRLGLGIRQYDARHDARMLLKAISLMKEQHCNAIIFPEGGRFNDGKIHLFQCGFVMLARKAGVPVIPVCIKGMGAAYPPQTFFFYSHKVTAIVGLPLIIKDEETDQDFCNRVVAWFDNCDVV